MTKNSLCLIGRESFLWACCSELPNWRQKRGLFLNNSSKQDQLNQFAHMVATKAITARTIPTIFIIISSSCHLIVRFESVFRKKGIIVDPPCDVYMLLVSASSDQKEWYWLSKYRWNYNLRFFFQKWNALYKNRLSGFELFYPASSPVV